MDVAVAATVSVVAQQKPVLIFSIGQGFPNGPEENQDYAALGRVITTLKKLSKSYSTYALLTADQTNQAISQAMLDLLSVNHIPFYLDTYSSDALTNITGNSPYDVSHGVALSLDRLQALRDRYGVYFAGIRFMEVFSMNFTVYESIHQGKKSWTQYFADRLPKDGFFHEDILDGEVKFAARNQMKVLFSDWYWSFDHPVGSDTTALNQTGNEAALNTEILRYPGTIYVVYANNEPGGRSQTIGDWTAAFHSLSLAASAGFGLSDQAWIIDKDPMSVPPTTLIQWATDAVQKGAAVIEFEPYWYFWNFPAGSAGNNYATARNDVIDGTPRPALVELGTALGVDLSTP